MSPTCHLVHEEAGNPRAGQVVVFSVKAKKRVPASRLQGTIRRPRSDARCVLFVQVELLFLFMAADAALVLLHVAIA